MGKTRTSVDCEAESERRPPSRLDPEYRKKREAHWRDEVTRVGRGDRHGGVYYVGNFDHDGNELSGDELVARDARHARDDDDNPLHRDTDD